jgi:hypothetical protein
MKEIWSCANQVAPIDKNIKIQYQAIGFILT